MVSWKKILLCSGLSVSGLLLAACSFYKPLRALAPEAFSLTCTSDNLCVQDPSRLAEATLLWDDATGFLAENIGPIERLPRVLFCSSQDCFSQFGNPKVAALYLSGLQTLLINDKGWHDYILRHELIHHWQTEQFGPVRFSRLPSWYIEGMAYALSQDPRNPLPRTDIQEWRGRFNAWVEQGNDWRDSPQP